MAENGAMKTRIHLARTGSFTDGHNRAVTLDASMLSELAESYDVASFKAPLVLGHPADGAPAYGWIENLVVEGQDLYGEVGEVAPELTEAVSKGQYKNVSISWWPKGHASSPAADRPALRHVGVLGAQVPVIKGLTPLELSEADDEIVAIEFSENAFAFRTVRHMFRGLRDFMLERFGAEDADKAIPDYLIENLNIDDDDVAAIFADPTPPTPPQPKSEEPTMSGADDTKTPPAELAEAQTTIAAQQAEIAQLKAVNETRDAKARDDAAMTFAEGLVNAGKLAPAGKDAVAAIHKTLATADPFEFADGSKPGALASFTGLFDTAQPIVELAELTKDENAKTIDGNDQAALTAAAAALQKENPAMSFSEAIRQAEKEADK